MSLCRWRLDLWLDNPVRTLPRAAFTLLHGRPVCRECLRRVRRGELRP